MLSRPSWGRRKGGEGSTEDGRPGQAKNAIAPVVGAGRPLCLDGTGSGDTQDEPRDHWYLLADRLVARARREVLGPTGRCFSTTPPASRVWGTWVHFPGTSPSCCGVPRARFLRDAPHPTSGALCFPSQASPLAFFLCAPAGPSLPSSAEIPSPVSIPIAPQPSPAVRGVNLPGSLPQRLGVVDPLGVGGSPCECGPEASPRKWVSSCAQPYKHTTSFFPPFLESDLERT